MTEFLQKYLGHCSVQMNFIKNDVVFAKNDVFFVSNNVLYEKINVV